MADYLLAAHIQVTGGAEATATFNQLAVQINNFGRAAQQAGTNQMAGSLDKAAESGGRLHAIMGQIGIAITRMATYQGLGALASGFGDAVSSVLSFDQAMTESLAIQTGVTTQMRSRMEDMAESIGREFGEAPAEVARGFYFMASAGLSAEQQMASLPTVMQYARAGMMSLEQATEQLFDALTAVGQRSDDPDVMTKNLTNLSDVLTEAAIRSQATIQQMGQALTTKAGPAIKGFNLDLNESVGMLEVFANQGVKGRTAGERFSMLIRDMALKSQKFGDEWAKVGVQVFDSEGNFNSLVSIMGQLDAALLPLSGQERIQTLSKMGFTLRDINTVMSVLGSSGDLGKFVFELDHAGGVAQRVAEKQMASLTNQLKQLSVSLQIGAIEGFEQLKVFGAWLSDTFAPALAALGPAAGAFGRGIGDVAAGLGTLIVGGAQAGLEGLAAAIGSIGAFASQHEGAVEAFGIAIGSLAGAKAISNLVAFGTAFGTQVIGKISQMAPLLQAVAAEMTATFAASGGGMGGAIRAMSTGLTGVLELLSAVPLAGAVLAGGVAAAAIVWKQHTDNAREAKAAVDAVVQSIAGQLGVSVDEAAGAIARLRQETTGGAGELSHMAEAGRNAMEMAVQSRVANDGLAEAFSKVGFSVKDVATAMATGTDFFEGWDQDTKTIAEMRGELESLPPSVRAVAEQLLNARESGAITAPEFFQLARSLDHVADTSDQAAGKFREFAEATLAGAMVSGEIDQGFLKFFGIAELGKASIDQLASAMERLNNMRAPVDEELWGQADAAMHGMAVGVEDVGNAADDAAAKVEEFNAALEALAGPANTMAALAKLRDGMREAQQAAQDYVLQTGPLNSAFTDTSAAADKVKESFAGLTGEAIDWANKLATDGNLEGAKQSLIDYRAGIVGIMQQFQMSEPEIQAVLGQLGLTDAQINTLNSKEAIVKVSAPDAPKTQAELDAISEKERQAVIKAQTDQATKDQADADLNSVIATPRVAEYSPFVLPDAMAESESQLTTTARHRDSEAAQWPSGFQSVEEFFSRTARYRNSQADQYGTGWNSVEGFFDRAARYRASQADQIANTAEAEQAMNTAARNRTSTISVNVVTTGTVYAGPAGTGIAEGGIVHAYASGGFENHVAQIGKMGHSRVWNEPETGGEAYIPLALGKRSRSMAIWEETGRILGAQASSREVNMTAPINVSVNGATDPEATGRAVASQVQSGIEAAMSRVLVELRSA